MKKKTLHSKSFIMRQNNINLNRYFLWHTIKLVILWIWHLFKLTAFSHILQVHNMRTQFETSLLKNLKKPFLYIWKSKWNHEVCKVFRLKKKISISQQVRYTFFKPVQMVANRVWLWTTKDSYMLYILDIYIYALFKYFLNFKQKMKRIFNLNYWKTNIKTLYTNYSLAKNVMLYSHLEGLYTSYSQVKNGIFFSKENTRTWYTTYWQTNIGILYATNFNEQVFRESILKAINKPPLKFIPENQPEPSLDVFINKLIAFYKLWPLEQWLWSLGSLIVLYWITGHFYNKWLGELIQRKANRFVEVSLNARVILILLDLWINVYLGLHYMEHRDTVMGIIMIKCPIAVSPVIFSLELLYLTLYYFYNDWLSQSSAWREFWERVNKNPNVILVRWILEWSVLIIPVTLCILFWFVPLMYFLWFYGGWKCFLFFWFCFLCTVIMADFDLYTGRTYYYYNLGLSEGPGPWTIIDVEEYIFPWSPKEKAAFSRVPRPF